MYRRMAATRSFHGQFIARMVKGRSNRNIAETGSMTAAKAGRRTAVFTAGPAPTGHLDAEIVHASANLADRAVLRVELEAVDAEVYLVEIKAAGIDVVADTARARGAEVVFAGYVKRLTAQ